ncbi:MAG: PQQ-binding-like beta-propeller repeat protein [Planctomycetales bacterium]|nr:PQQ-binding-like beta-propeller repeat protein [Planctomycetales bacterium]
MLRLQQLIVVVGLLSTSSLLAGDWPAFRGPDGTGLSNEKNVPLKWSPTENIKWKAPLPAPGNGSPIVSKGKVFVTVATDKGKKRSLLCYDRKTGEQLWAKHVAFEGDEPTHGTNPIGSSTPVADGERIVVWHSSAGVVCYDFDGNELWKRDLGTFRHIWGYGQSPVILGDSVILNCGPGVRTFVTALDRKTGETLWQTDEPGGDAGLESVDGKRAPWIGSWSTPVIIRVDGQPQILVSFPHHANAYDPKTGKILWTCDGLGDLVYTSPVIGDGVAVTMGGFHGPAIAFKLGGSGNVTETNRLWQIKPGNPQRIGSGVILGKHMFMANAGPPIAQCIVVETGEDLWKERMPGNDNWGSMIHVDGRLYVTNQAGGTNVIAPNVAKFELLATNELGENSNSTPAFSDGQIFLRTFKHLWCIGE